MSNPSMLNGLRTFQLEDFFASVDLTYFKYENRLDTFAGKWPYDRMPTAKCTSVNMAKAGFVCTSSGANSDPEAHCYICLHEMIWDEAGDNPKQEHYSHCPECVLAKMDKPEDEYSVKDVLKLMAYAYSTKMYKHVDDAYTNLEVLMHNLIVGFEQRISNQ